MIIEKLDTRENEVITQLVSLWRKSVEQTHAFLTAKDIDEISEYVPSALKEVPLLLIVKGQEEGNIAGFAGADGNRLEMLFLDPDQRGQGIGRLLATEVIRHYNITEVCVNEQNPQAKGFYERMGFEVYRREPVDEQGKPFPLLYMRLKSYK